MKGMEQTMIGQAKKKLIIVTDEKTTTYAELLSALVTMSDDGETTVGVKDGTVETVIWSEKIYADNQAQLGSGNRIVFIGKNDTAQTVLANINCQNDLSEYGIFYGSASNKAVVYVTDVHLAANKEKYDAFYAVYSEFLSAVGSQFIADQIHEKIEMKGEDTSQPEKERGAFAKAAIGLFRKVDQAASKGISVIVNSKEIADQQYRLAVIAFYINALAAFMGE